MRIHVHFRGLDEFGVGKIAIEHGAVHREVGRVDLQQHASAVDGEIFVAHLARQSGQIGFLRIIVRVQHRSADDAGRGRRHEGLGECSRILGGTLEAIDLAVDGGRIQVMQFGLRFRGVLHAAAFRESGA